MGEKVILAHDVDAARRLQMEFGRRGEPGVPAGGDDATRHLLETVLQGEEAYVASLSTRIELARRQGALLRHAHTRRSIAPHRAG